MFFWLHIKKSAGITTRKLLHPYYTEVDRVNKPGCFIQSSPNEYNDILNNFRLVLGEYQFKRALFAKKFLYPDEWSNMITFAFSRDPIDRCISMFHYLYWQHGLKGWSKEMKNTLRRLFKMGGGPINYNKSYAFSAFLNFIEEARDSESNFRPFNLHFTTHTAPMWDDITDFEGNIVLSRIYRLENLIKGINEVFADCGLNKKIYDSNLQLNKNRKKKEFVPKPHHVKKIKKIYAQDFEIYESIAT